MKRLVRSGFKTSAISSIGYGKPKSARTILTGETSAPSSIAGRMILPQLDFMVCYRGKTTVDLPVYCFTRM